MGKNPTYKGMWLAFLKAFPWGHAITHKSTNQVLKS